MLKYLPKVLVVFWKLVCSYGFFKGYASNYFPNQITEYQADMNFKLCQNMLKLIKNSQNENTLKLSAEIFMRGSKKATY